MTTILSKSGPARGQMPLPRKGKRTPVESSIRSMPFLSAAGLKLRSVCIGVCVQTCCKSLLKVSSSNYLEIIAI